MVIEHDHIDEEKINSMVEGSPYGVKAVFVKLDDKWAIKLFYDIDDRNEIYENQKRAAKYGLGPNVGEKINFSMDCERPYGYITEIVEVLVPHEEVANDEWETFDYYDLESEDFHEKTQELQKQLERYTGTYYRDLHPNNIGIKDGHYILIDFGTND